jgi:hypothetical protein
LTLQTHFESKCGDEELQVLSRLSNRTDIHTFSLQAVPATQYR